MTETQKEKTLIHIQVGDDYTNVIVKNPENIKEIAKAWVKEHRKYGTPLPEWIGTLIRFKRYDKKKLWRYLNPETFLKLAGVRKLYEQ